MRSSLPSYEQQISQRASRRPGEPAQRAGYEPWTMRLSISQVLILWSVLAGVMVLVFLFGLYSGREQGLEFALEEYRQTGARIPVVEPQAVTDDAREVLSSIGSISDIAKSSGAELPRPSQNERKAAEQKADKGAAGTERVFDFTEAAKSAAGNQNTGAVQKSGTSVASPKLPNLDEGRLQDESGGVTAEMGLFKGEDAQSQPKPKAEPPAPKPQAVAPAKPPMPVKPEVKVAPPPAVIPGGWYIQVAATREMSQAQQIAQNISKQGFQSVTESAKVREANYYRVLVGPYPDRDSALSAKAQIKRKQISRAEPFLKRIK